MSSGLGKSLQAIILARYKKEHQGLKHCLIICGVNSLKWNWQREIEKFCPEERGIVLGTALNKKGTIKSLTVEETKNQISSCPEEFFWIINIEKMRVTSEGKKNKTDIVHYLNKQIELGNLGMVLIDEVHTCLSYNTEIVTDVGRLSIGYIVENNVECNVMSYNIVNGKYEWKPIKNRYKIKSPGNMVHIVLDDNSVLDCTVDHKIYTINRGWVSAMDLTEKDEVIKFE